LQAATRPDTHTPPRHTHDVTSVCFSPDGKRIAPASKDRTVKVWDAATGQETLSLRGHTEQVTSVGFSPDGQRIVSVGGNRTIVWEAADGKRLPDLKAVAGPEGPRSPDGS